MSLSRITNHIIATKDIGYKVYRVYRSGSVHGLITGHSVIFNQWMDSNARHEHLRRRYPYPMGFHIYTKLEDAFAVCASHNKKYFGRREDKPFFGLPSVEFLDELNIKECTSVFRLRYNYVLASGYQDAEEVVIADRILVYQSHETPPPPAGWLAAWCKNNSIPPASAAVVIK